MAGVIRKTVTNLEAYVPGEQLAGADVVKLNTNENPYPPSPAVAEALRDFDMDRLRRYPDPVSLRLREAIAERVGCRIENIFVGNGSDEILALCTRAFVENDGGIGYFVPSYSLYPVLADIRAVRRCETPLAPGFSWSEPRVDGCSLFFMTSPNAPTGMAWPRESVLKFCEEFEGVVVLDEAYADFAEHNFLDEAHTWRNILVMRTFSKAYSLAGLRVGFVVGPEALIEALFKIKDSYNLDAPAQALAEVAVRDQAGMRANRDRIVATRGRLAAALDAMGFEVYPSQTNFLWVKPSAVPARQLFQRLRERRILVRHFDGQLTGEYLRITVGTDQDVDILLAALRDLTGDDVS